MASKILMKLYEQLPASAKTLAHIHATAHAVVVVGTALPIQIRALADAHNTAPSSNCFQLMLLTNTNTRANHSRLLGTHFVWRASVCSSVDLWQPDVCLVC